MEKFINNKMNTLLVSENDSDYETLVKYGFKNITYFKSPIIALEYFEEHPLMKEQYELIICGDFMADGACFNHPRFTHKIENLFKEQDCHIFDKYYYGSQFKYNRNLLLEKRTFYDLEEILDRYLNEIETKESNKEFKQVILKEKEATLPKKIEDIKVLFLQSGYCYRPKTNAEVLNNIGIKTFALTDDSNFGPQRNAVPYLGYYDIIIAGTGYYSKKLLELEKEVLEQNKYRDNGITMLVCNEVGGCYTDFHVAFDCSFVSNFYPNLPKKEKNYFNIYSQNEEYIPNEYFLKTVIRRYIDELNKINKEKIDTDLPSVEEMMERRRIEAEEREKRILELERQREEEEKPLRNIEYIRNYAKRYLKLKRKGIHLQSIEGLVITEKNNYITVSFTIQNRTLCAISFSNNISDNDESLKLFALQTVSKKGNLSEPVELAVYLDNWSNKQNIPRKPTDDEWQKIEGIKKRVEKVLEPIVNESTNNYLNNSDRPHSYRKRKKYYRK